MPRDRKKKDLGLDCACANSESVIWVLASGSSKLQSKQIKRTDWMKKQSVSSVWKNKIVVSYCLTDQLFATAIGIDQ